MVKIYLKYVWGTNTFNISNPNSFKKENENVRIKKKKKTDSN